MKLLYFVFLGCVLADPVFADYSQFVERWKQHDEQIQVSDYAGREYDKIIRKKFNDLKAYDGRLERTGGDEIEDVLVVYSQENMTILLATPGNAMRNVTVLNEEYRQAQMKCGRDRSWLIMLPENAWTEIDLNPHCAMDYDEDDIVIDLYWPGSSARPLIDIITDGLTCVPHRLYGWDRRTDSYKPLSMKCTGLNVPEGYSATGSEYRQLF